MERRTIRKQEKNVDPFDAEMHDISESYVDSTLGTEVYALSVSLWIDFRSVVHHRRIHPVHEAKGSESVVRHQTIRVNCFENEKICFARSVSIHCYLYNGRTESKIAKMNSILFGQFYNKRIERVKNRKWEKFVKLELELEFVSFVSSIINVRCRLFNIRLVCLCFELNMKFVIFSSLKKIKILTILFIK